SGWPEAARGFSRRTQNLDDERCCRNTASISFRFPHAVVRVTEVLNRFQGLNTVKVGRCGPSFMTGFSPRREQVCVTAREEAGSHGTGQWHRQRTAIRRNRCTPVGNYPSTETALEGALWHRTATTGQPRSVDARGRLPPAGTCARWAERLDAPPARADG